jgi:hypothetical protein
MTNVIQFPARPTGRHVDWFQLAEELNAAADWRRQKASEYPHDAERNLAAAERLQYLAQDCLKVGVCGRYGNSRVFEAAIQENPELWVEWHNQSGMILPPKNLEEMIACCLRFT